MTAVVEHRAPDLKSRERRRGDFQILLRVVGTAFDARLRRPGAARGGFSRTVCTVLE